MDRVVCCVDSFIAPQSYCKSFSMSGLCAIMKCKKWNILLVLCTMKSYSVKYINMNVSRLREGHACQCNGNANIPWRYTIVKNCGTNIKIQGFSKWFTQYFIG